MLNSHDVKISKKVCKFGTSEVLFSSNKYVDQLKEKKKKQAAIGSPLDLVLANVSISYEALLIIYIFCFRICWKVIYKFMYYEDLPRDFLNSSHENTKFAIKFAGI